MFGLKEAMSHMVQLLPDRLSEISITELLKENNRWEHHNMMPDGDISYLL